VKTAFGLGLPALIGSPVAIARILRLIHCSRRSLAPRWSRAGWRDTVAGLSIKAPLALDELLAETIDVAGLASRLH